MVEIVLEIVFGRRVGREREGGRGISRIIIIPRVYDGNDVGGRLLQQFGQPFSLRVMLLYAITRRNGDCARYEQPTYVPIVLCATGSFETASRCGSSRRRRP